MDAKAIRMFVERHPGGVVIRMIDGTEYEIPHRDYIWFTPVFAEADRKAQRPASSFWIADTKSEEYQLVNSLLVKAVVPLKNTSGNGKHGGRGRKAS